MVGRPLSRPQRVSCGKDHIGAAVSCGGFSAEAGGPGLGLLVRLLFASSSERSAEPRISQSFWPDKILSSHSFFTTSAYRALLLTPLRLPASFLGFPTLVLPLPMRPATHAFSVKQAAQNLARCETASLAHPRLLHFGRPLEGRVTTPFMASAREQLASCTKAE